MFGAKLAPAEAERLAEIPRLAPGDCRTVRQSLFYLGSDVTDAERLNVLERESARRGENRTRGK